MKRRVLLFLALSILLTGANAQKIDQRLTRLAKQVTMSRAQGNSQEQTFNPKQTPIALNCNADGSIRSFSVQAYLKNGAECPTELLEQKGIKVRFVADNVAVLSVPVDKLSELEDIDELQFAKADEFQPMNNDEARKMSKADLVTSNVEAIKEGLPQAYTGKGVVLGIIDGGIDFNHAAFRDANGISRIKRVVMFLDTEGQKMEFDTPEGIAALDADVEDQSHGTHTLATAAGSAVGNGLQGVAPEVDIMAVALGLAPSESNMAEGIRLIAQYANSVNKPCVISMSMGTQNDLHDGSSVVCKVVKEVTSNGTKQGIAVLISSGNLALCNSTIIKKLGTPDSDGWQLKGIFGNDADLTQTDVLYPSYNGMKFVAYAEDGKDFTAELKIVNIATGEVISDLTEQLIGGEMWGYQPIGITMNKYTEYVNAKGDKTVLYRCSDKNQFTLVNKNYRMALFVKGAEGQVIKILNSDKGASEPNFFVPEALAGQGYVAGNNVLSCNSNTCDDAVISVGSAVSRLRWYYYLADEGAFARLRKSELTGEYPKIGDVSDFSSYCLADDNGKARPTLVGPGQNVNSAYNLYDATYFDKTTQEWNEKGNRMELMPETQQMYLFGRKNWYGTMGGTSMSTPHVAGVVALWMQAKPTLTVNEIKEVMKATCTSISATQCPSKDVEQAGYGMIDAMAGLKKIMNVTGINAVSMSDRREATPATMYSVDAPVYNMMGQRVSKSTKGLVIYKGRKYLNK